MPNGARGDHPITDMLLHGTHPFPSDIEAMRREILESAPGFPDDKRFGRYYKDQLQWEDRIHDMACGMNLDEGRKALRKALEVLQIENENQAGDR